MTAIAEAIADLENEANWARTEVSAQELAAALKAVLPHVGGKDRPGALEMVQAQFRPIDNAWKFTATNSYTLAESEVNAGLTVEEIERLAARFDVFEVLITKADAKRIMDRAKSQRGGVTLVCASDPHAVLDIVWEYGAVTERVLNQGTAYSYPKTEHLFPKSETVNGPVKFSLSGDYLALFKPSTLARAGEKNEGVVFTFSDEEGRKPLLVTFSDHFRGLIMPRRIPS